MNSQIFFVRGLPGSGKSYLAQAMTSQLEARGRKVVILDPDAINYESDEYLKHVEQQNAEGVDPTLHRYRFLRAKAFTGIDDGAAIIWNQAFANLEAFNNITARFKEYAQEHNVDLQILIVEVDTPAEIAKARVAERAGRGGHDVPDERFKKFVEDYKTFANEGYDVISVDGTGDVKTNADDIISKLSL